jgi:hypothetical protein
MCGKCGCVFDFYQPKRICPPNRPPTDAAKEKAPAHLEVDTGAKYMLIAGLRVELVHPREPTSPSTTAYNNLQANV